MAKAYPKGLSKLFDFIDPTHDLIQQQAQVNWNSRPHKITSLYSTEAGLKGTGKTTL